MAFENGFDPREHLEPIIACLRRNPGLKEGILSLVDLHAKGVNLEKIFSSVKDLMQDDWAYSCLRQFLLYDEARADEIWGEKMSKLGDIEMEPEYKDFFERIRNAVRFQ